MLAQQDGNEMIIPSLDVKHHGKVPKEVIFKLNNQNNHDSQMGNAFVHILNEEWILGSLENYIRTLPDVNIDYKEMVKIPKEKLFEFNQLRQLQDMLNRVVHSAVKVEGTFSIIQSLKIDQIYRNKKLFKPFLWMMLKTLKEYFAVDWVLLDAAPFEIARSDWKEYQKEKKRLEKMYSKFGFIKKVNSTDERRHFMLLNLKGKSFHIYN